jgi:DNA primase
MRLGDGVDFREVKEAVSMEAVLRHYQVRGLRRQRSQLQGPCPIHGGERKDSFRARLRKNAFHCFSCQAQGNVLDFVAAIESCSVRDAALRLRQWFGVSGPTAVPTDIASAAGKAPGKFNWFGKKEGGNPVLGFRLGSVDWSHP